MPDFTEEDFLDLSSFESQQSESDQLSDYYQTSEKAYIAIQNDPID